MALYAGLRLGAIVVPVNPRSAAPEIDDFVTDSGATLLFGPELAPTIQAWRDLPGRAGDVPTLALGAAAGFDDVLASSLSQSADPVEVDVREDDDALIIFVTTGPKGALSDQHRILWVGVNTAFGLGLREGERMLHVAPLYHSAALNILLIGGMGHGATLPDAAVLLPRAQASVGSPWPGPTEPDTPVVAKQRAAGRAPSTQLAGHRPHGRAVTVHRDRVQYVPPAHGGTARRR